MDTGRYRGLLQDLHSDLSDEDVKNLKFLAQPLIKKRLFGTIKDGLELFEALEDCNMLSAWNLTFLSELLETTRRLDLQAKIAAEIVSCDAVSGESLLVCPFRRLLFSLHKEIPDEDLKRMCFLCTTIPKRASIEDPLDLFSFMMRERCLAPDNLGFLKRLFTEISRMDLCQDVTIFEVTVSPHECGYVQILNRASGVVFQTASSESSLSTMCTTEPRLEDLKEGLSHQEWGHSEQEQEMAPVFQTASVQSSSCFAGLSTLSQSPSNKDDLDASRGSDSKPTRATSVAPPGLTSDKRPNIDSSMDTNVNEPDSSSIGNSVTSTSVAETGPAAAAAASDPVANFYKVTELLDRSDCYKMDAEPRGICLILDVQNFTKDPSDSRAKKMSYRGGSQVDRENLKTTFQKLKFLVEDVINPTDEEIRQILRHFASVDHQAYNCFVLCVLSHGTSNSFYGSNGRAVEGSELSDIFSPHRSPTLAGKPKLFFFAHCRGEQHRPAVSVRRDRQEEQIEMDAPTNPVFKNAISNEMDFLFAYATTLHSVSYRSQSKGTFFVETLTQVFQEHAPRRMELQHLLLRVHNQVTQKDYAKDTVYRQTPDTHHTLRGRVYFL